MNLDPDDRGREILDLAMFSSITWLAVSTIFTGKTTELFCLVQHIYFQWDIWLNLTRWVQFRYQRTAITVLLDATQYTKVLLTCLLFAPQHLVHLKLCKVNKQLERMRNEYNMYIACGCPPTCVGTFVCFICLCLLKIYRHMCSKICSGI